MAAGLGMAGFSPASYACSVEPYVGSVCVMAVSPTRFPGIGTSYVLAMGQTMQINQSAALYSLVGMSFGGDGSSKFNLPDLRGKVIVGYDPRNTAGGYLGATGGNASIKLTIAQLPAHFMNFNVPINANDVNNVTAKTTLAGLSATANLSNLVISGSASGLTVKASSSGGLGTPNGNYLGKSGGGAGNIYSNITPDGALNAATIGGTLSLTVNAGVTAPVTVTGDATTTLTGAVSGKTDPVGGNADIPIMPPYLVMPYYIAVNGIYPPSND